MIHMFSSLYFDGEISLPVPLAHIPLPTHVHPNPHIHLILHLLIHYQQMILRDGLLQVFDMNDVPIAYAYFGMDGTCCMHVHYM